MKNLRPQDFKSDYDPKIDEIDISEFAAIEAKSDPDKPKSTTSTPQNKQQPTQSSNPINQSSRSTQSTKLVDQSNRLTQSTKLVDQPNEPTQSTKSVNQSTKSIDTTDTADQSNTSTTSTQSINQLVGPIVKRPHAFYLPKSTEDKINEAVVYYQTHYHEKIDRSAVVSAFLGDPNDWTKTSLDAKAEAVLVQFKNRARERLADRLI